MPCTKQSTRRYVDRNSPPYPGNQCPEGMRLRGNDGAWYVVSRPNVNGVKRWLREPTPKAPTRRGKKAPTPKTPKAPSRRKRAPRAEPAPPPFNPYAPSAPPASPAPVRPSVRPTTQPRRKLPRRPPMPRNDRDLLEDVPWRMASRVDNGMVMQARVHLTEPTSALYFLYEVLYERFVEMNIFGDAVQATVVGIDRAQQLIQDGYKVWVVSSSPIDLELD